MSSQQASGQLRPFRPRPFGRYTLLLPISSGGMGELFLARLEGAQGFGKLCVIKRILPELAGDPDFVARFVSEAKTLVQLNHGSVTQVLDMDLSEGSPYLALEFVDGKDLRKVAARMRDRRQPLPLPFVLYVMCRVLDALAYAHRKRDDNDQEINLVHRDISPQNILVSYEGEVKVIDFGLAKSTLSEAQTHPSLILGKFLYMSPEQAQHQRADRRSDLYSVGVCLYELVAMKNPFEEVPSHELMAAVAHPQIPSLRGVEPRCPESLDAVVMRALAADREKRFQTAEELRSKLLSCLMELDPEAGPEWVSRFMRDTFSAEYQSERKWLARFREPVFPVPSPVDAGQRATGSQEGARSPESNHPAERVSTPEPLALALPSNEGVEASITATVALDESARTLDEEEGASALLEPVDENTLSGSMPASFAPVEVAAWRRLPLRLLVLAAVLLVLGTLGFVGYHLQREAQALRVDLEQKKK
ncbi:MAG: serine/threonine protein kinase [Myxococcota bacterium]